MLITLSYHQCENNCYMLGFHSFCPCGFVWMQFTEMANKLCLCVYLFIHFTVFVLCRLHLRKIWNNMAKKILLKQYKKYPRWFAVHQFFKIILILFLSHKVLEIRAQLFRCIRSTTHPSTPGALPEPAAFISAFSNTENKNLSLSECSVFLFYYSAFRLQKLLSAHLQLYLQNIKVQKHWRKRPLFFDSPEHAAALGIYACFFFFRERERAFFFLPHDFGSPCKKKKEVFQWVHLTCSENKPSKERGHPLHTV